MTASDAIPKAEFLARLGFGEDEQVLRALEEAGLTNPRKSAISPDKAEQAREVLEARFFRACTRGDCQDRAPSLAGGRLVARSAGPGSCEVCGGSASRAAIDEMVEACRAAGVTRICIVGGSPNTRHEIEQAVAGRLELRLIDGSGSRTGAAAKGDLAWAQRVFVWGGTELNHKVSKLYTGPTVIQTAKRGVSEMAKAITLSAQRAR